MATPSSWRASVPKAVAAGQVLRHEGDPAARLLLLLDGHVAATATSGSGRVVRFGEWAAPCALDKIAVIDGGGHTATLTALTPCVVRSLPRERFLDLVDDESSDGTGRVALGGVAHKPWRVESAEREMPRGFDSYGTALWWTAMLLTTMGTEYWPQTAEGRVLCFLLSLYGFAVFGYVTAALASYFIASDADTEDTELVSAKPIKELRAEIASLHEELRALRRKNAVPE